MLVIFSRCYKATALQQFLYDVPHDLRMISEILYVSLMHVFVCTSP